MRKIICLLLAFSMLLSFAVPSYANESEEPWYGTLNVEYSDALGTLEQLDVMIKNDHVYAEVNALSERLGYKCMRDGDLLSIYADDYFFHQDVPLLAVHFSIHSTDVYYNPLFGVWNKYTAPAPCVKDAEGEWVPLTYTLVLLGGNSTLLGDTLLIEMPRDNVLSVAAMIANNDMLFSFDWVDDFGYSETTTNVTDGAARIVTLFSGLLEFDGAAWLSLIDWSAFDKKYGDTLVTMFCTNSAEELEESIDQVEVSLEVFSNDGKLGEMLRNKQIQIDGDVSKWGDECKEYLDILEAGSGSPAEYNRLYQQYERAMDQQDLFATLGGENLIYLQDSLSSATNVLDIASILGSTVCYLSEFQQKDEYMFSVLKNYLKHRTPTDKLPDATAQAMQNYLTVMDLGGLGYSAYRYIEENWLKCIVDESGIDTLMGAPANALLFAWDIMSETIPFYSEGLKSVENREISNYAQKMQNDALDNVNSLLYDLSHNSPTEISAADCIQLSEYCYVYLKACYIARATAIKSLDNTSEEFRNQIQGTLNVESDINMIIAHYLAVLSSADAENTCYVLGFLPENNDEYLQNCSDAALLAAALTPDYYDVKDKRLEQINKYDEAGLLIQKTTLIYGEDGFLNCVKDEVFDRNGNVTATGSSVISMDSKGRVINMHPGDSPYLHNLRAEYVYNDIDQLVSCTLVDGGGSKTEYFYDEFGMLIKEKATHLSAFAFDTGEYFYENDVLTRKLITHEYDHGDGMKVSTEEILYTVDNQGRITEENNVTRSSVTRYCYDYWPVVTSVGTTASIFKYVDSAGHQIFREYMQNLECFADGDGYLAKIVGTYNLVQYTYEFVYEEVS